MSVSVFVILFDSDRPVRSAAGRPYDVAKRITKTFTLTLTFSMSGARDLELGAQGKVKRSKNSQMRSDVASGDVGQK